MKIKNKEEQGKSSQSPEPSTPAPRLALCKCTLHGTLNATYVSIMVSGMCVVKAFRPFQYMYLYASALRFTYKYHTFPVTSTASFET